MTKNITAAAIAFLAFTFLAFYPTTSFAQDSASDQDETATIDASAVSESGNKPADFAPKGWKVEEDVKGDLNGDGIVDHSIKLIEDKPGNTEDRMNDRSRALVVVFGRQDGGLVKAAVAGKLLQCTGCGGAFYGAMDAPANVKIQKGVIIVEQDSGSRWVTDTTYRFRYDEQPGMFILIGYDYSSRDRAEGSSSSESTNYLTGKRITTVAKGKKTTTKTTTVAKDRMSIEEVDSEEMDAAATHRLGLD